MAVCISLVMLFTITVAGTLAFPNWAQNARAKTARVEIKVQQTADQIYPAYNSSYYETSGLLADMPGLESMDIRMENSGTVQLYMRCFVAVPKCLDGALKLVFTENQNYTTECFEDNIDGVPHTVYRFTHNNAVDADTVTAPVISGFYLDSSVQVIDGEIYVNGSGTGYRNDKINFITEVQSVQKYGEQTLEQAFLNAGFPSTPWRDDGDKTTETETDRDSILAAINKDGKRAITTDVIFDVASGYTAYINGTTDFFDKDAEGKVISFAVNGDATAYYKTYTVIVKDANNNDTQQERRAVYILSDRRIQLPESCKELFKNMKELVFVDTANCYTDNVTSMYAMFQGCSKLQRADTGRWNTSKVKDMSLMFYGCSALEEIDVSGWNMSKVTSVSQMFHTCSNLKALDVSGWNVDKVINMERLFQNCGKLTMLDLSGWNTANVTNMNWMFYGDGELKTIYAGDFWQTAPDGVDNNYIGSKAMFWGCSDLVGGNGTVYNGSFTDGTYACIDTSATPGYFTAKT